MTGLHPFNYVIGKEGRAVAAAESPRIQFEREDRYAKLRWSAYVRITHVVVVKTKAMSKPRKKKEM